MTKGQEILETTCKFSSMIYSKYQVDSYGIKPSMPFYNKELVEELKLKRDVINNNIIDYLPLISFEFKQVIEEDVWTVQHQLGYNPKVIVSDNKNKQLFPIVQYTTDGDILTLTFSLPTCGKAFLFYV